MPWERADAPTSCIAAVFGSIAAEDLAAKLQTMIEQLPVAIFIHPLEADASPIYFSPQLEQMTGYAPADLPRHCRFLLPFVHADDLPAVEREIARTDITLEPLEPLDVTYRLRRKDGRWIWVHNRTTLIRDADGAPSHWQGVLVDVTAEKQAEAERAAGEARLDAVARASTDIIAVVDASGVLTWISPSVTAILGHPPADLTGKSPAGLVHPDDLPLTEALVAAIVAAPGDAGSVEVRLRRTDGSWRWFDAAATSHLHDPAIRGAVFTLREITSRKMAEEGLAASEALFRSTFEAAPTGMAIVDTEGVVLDANRALTRFIGYSREELIAMGSMATRLLVAENLAEQSALHQRLVAGEIPSYQLEHRFRHKDGTLIRGRLNVSGVRDAGGELIRLISQVEDINGYREALDALATGEARLRMVIETAHDVVIVSDADGVIRWVSPSVKEFSGFDPSQVIGAQGGAFVHPDDREAQAAHRAALIAYPERLARTRLRLRRADGEVATVEATSVNELVNPAIGGMLTVLHVISGRPEEATAAHEAQAIQQAAERRLEHLNRQREAFVDLLSREFRGSLTDIQGYGDLLGFEVRGQPDAIDYADAISSRARRLNRLVGSLVQATIADDPLPPLVRVPASLTTLLRDAAPLLCERWPDDRVRMTLACRLPTRLLDTDLLIRAIVALADAALERSSGDAPVTLMTRMEGRRQRLDITSRTLRLTETEADLLLQTPPRPGEDSPAFALAVARAHDGSVWATCPPDGPATLHLDIGSGEWIAGDG
jgi:PAS domain S-box-containing protein